MSLKDKINLNELRKKAEQAIVTDVEKDLDRVRDKIFAQAEKIGGWKVYVDRLQKQRHFHIL